MKFRPVISAYLQVEGRFNWLRYHFFNRGLKFIRLDAEIKRRIKRQRPAAYADLICIRSMLKIEFKMPPAPKRYDRYWTVEGDDWEEFVKTHKFLKNHQDNVTHENGRVKLRMEISKDKFSKLVREYIYLR